MSEQELLQAMAQAYRQQPAMVPEFAMRAVLNILHAHGYRRCAEGQGVTQWCERANKAEAALANLQGDYTEETGYLRSRAEAAEAEVGSLKARLFEMQQAAKDLAKRAEAAEAERLREIEDVSESFHKVAVRERDYERQRVERLTAEREIWRGRTICADDERDRLREENKRLKESVECWADQCDQRVKDWDDMRQRAEKAEAEVERLRSALTEAIEEVECWAGYVPEYFLKKHDYEGGIAKLRATIDAARGGEK